MLQLFRERVTLLLLGLLPFHAFLVTVGTKIIAGPGHAPLTYLALWKEAVLGVILVVAFAEILQKKSLVIGHWSLDILDRIIIGLLVLSVVVTAGTHSDWKLYLIGCKYDVIPLVAFLILRRVEWSDLFMNRLVKVLLAVAGIVAVYGILGMYMHQQFFVWLGYSDMHSLYQPDGPLAAFQQIGGTAIRRMQSTMSGPNQLGLWLLVPFSVVLARPKAVGTFVIFAMVLTLSRSALLAAAVMVTVVLWKQLPRKKFFQLSAVLFCMSFVCLFAIQSFSPFMISRAASTRDHMTRPLQAIQIMIQNPLGLGLGTAGPASNRVSDTCVYLDDGDDPSWAQVHKNLCVFVGTHQVQPLDSACRCPLLPENWYLQIGIELGVLGFVLYLTLIILLVKRLFVCSFFRTNESTNQRFSCSVALAFLGLSIASLFLHAWEDAAIAYTVWILVAIAMPKHYTVIHGT